MHARHRRRWIELRAPSTYVIYPPRSLHNTHKNIARPLVIALNRRISFRGRNRWRNAKIDCDLEHVRKFTVVFFSGGPRKNCIDTCSIQLIHTSPNYIFSENTQFSIKIVAKKYLQILKKKPPNPAPKGIRFRRKAASSFLSGAIFHSFNCSKIAQHGNQTPPIQNPRTRLWSHRARARFDRIWKPKKRVSPRWFVYAQT